MNINKYILLFINNKSLKKYKTSSPVYSPIWQEKVIETSLKRYNTYRPQQSNVYQKNFLKNTSKWKDYVLPSHKIIKVQGYENFLLDILFQKFHENDVLIGRIYMPIIFYQKTENQITLNRYFPDVYIPKINTVFEVKSNYTYENDIDVITKKIQATINSGLNLYLFIFDSYGNILKKYFY